MYSFNINKYHNWYYQIIDNARNRTIDGYIEKHHIIPRCLGGTDNKTNLVCLTAREHFIVHLLLIKMVKKNDVYKMVHAVIRFGDKVKNSKEYELLRTYVTKYSTGEYNTAYGKIWVHTNEEILFINKEDFDDAIHKKGLPHQRGGFKNYQWINNGLEQTMISKSTTIPSGWKKGRLFGGGNAEQLSQAAKKRHTKEKDLEHSKKLTGRIQIVKGTKSKKIHPSDLQKYISDGWGKGSISSAITRPFSINGKEYTFLYEAADDLDLHKETIRYRLKSKTEKWSEWFYTHKQSK